MNRRAPFRILVLFLAGCASPSPAPWEGPDPRFDAPSALDGRREPVALVLSGGAARGFAHVGVLKVLEARGLRPDIVVGSSAGAIVGALYASGLSASQVERSLAELGLSTFNDWALPWFGFGPGAMGVVRGDKLHRFIDDRVMHHRIEQFPIRFAAVATELQGGNVQIFNAGDAGRAVLASSAVPGVIAPVNIGGRLYSDGQISSPLPVQAARTIGARRIIAVDVLYPPEDASPRSAAGVLFQSFIVSAHRLKLFERTQADLVIAPELPRTTGQLGFGDRERLIAAGERAAEDSMEQIEGIFEATAVGEGANVIRPPAGGGADVAPQPKMAPTQGGH